MTLLKISSSSQGWFQKESKPGGSTIVNSSVCALDTVTGFDTVMILLVLLLEGCGAQWQVETPWLSLPFGCHTLWSGSKASAPSSMEEFFLLLDVDAVEPTGIL